jgi:hypothetical protein
MTERRRTRPSFGFLVLVASYVLLMSFLAWGYCQPDLERGWHILQRTQRDDFSGLSPSEATSLEQILERHPPFARALIGRRTVGIVEPTEEGWVTGLSRTHLVIQATPRLPLRVNIACRGPEAAYPVEVVFKTSGSQESLSFESDGEQVVDWSAKAAPRARWVEVNVRPHASGASVGVRPKIRIQVVDADTQKAAQ